MSAERDVNRIVRSWIRKEEHESADRVLQTVLSKLDATPQRRSWWPAWRNRPMNKVATTADAPERSSRRRALPALRSLSSLAGAGAAAVVFVVAGTVGLGLYITQQGAASPSPTTVPPTSGPIQVPGTSWPQSNRDEMQQAQELADAGDPRFAWQVDPALVDDAAPWAAEILDRFLRDGLGWQEFRTGGGFAYGDSGGLYTELVVVRCAPGQTNPLWADDPEARACAPTIDGFRYETVMLTLEQPVRRGPSGIWVVTEWEMLQPWEPSSLWDHVSPDFTLGQVQQVAPPSDAEATTILQSFLEARVAGAGAEQYLHWHEREAEAQTFVGPPYDGVPLLYSTSQGGAYERFEIDRLTGPVWPSGSIDVRVRLFAEDGTEVEQSFVVIRQEDGRIGLAYGVSWGAGGYSETENGQPVPVPYSFLGQWTFEAAPPWNNNPAALYIGNPGHDERFEMMADPLPVATGCEWGPTPADAEALAQSLLSDPDLDATAPVAVSIGGIDALQMDVVGAQGASVCDERTRGPLVLLRPGTSTAWELGPGKRMRLYLVDPPGGPATVVVIAIVAPEESFDRVVEAAMPILDSMEFQVP